MKVFLAGFNIDTDVLRQMQEKSGRRQDITPEVICAAYARISRDPRPVNEIRQDARNEVERSRKSNSTIIFKMGHHSVAEHAVFNLDILEVSRFAMEELEKFRLCSYTEKSQRYITLDNDFVVPEEIKNTCFEEMFISMIEQQNKAYFKLFERLKEYIFEKHAQLAKDPKNHNLLEGWAKEDARYVTALATHSQVGQTINARNLELLLRRFASHPLSEIKQLGISIYNQIASIAPSIVIFNEANERDLKTYPGLKKAAKELLAKVPLKLAPGTQQNVQLVEFTKNGDLAVAAALLHAATELTYEDCRVVAEKLSQEEQKMLFKNVWENMQFYDSMLREFEYTNLTFNIVLSAACFGQLKRHRMSTISAQEYDPNLGVTVPESVKETGMEKYFQEIIDKTNAVYNNISREIPIAAPYILTNAHRKRVLLRLNARELYHISRLREDTHSQWDIRNIAAGMSQKAKQVMPLTFACIGGKDKYSEIYKNLYGRLPKVTQAVLPQPRSIT
ncbi:MAG: FAD-dependent thymidylate synthase [Candidatus Omnitrophica bacterium]|nr:FAD-dependent thymidylate synthase [Candidatus Omnitrophota bacterium]